MKINDLSSDGRIINEEEVTGKVRLNIGVVL